ncbi:MAG: phosphatidate cytidylyltransferase [Candidatus Eremiobacteraeota bacterium]|nr:phosphatidate cytidylyltransferase [Candidatus Eremiobacteraeota bacterium]
MNTTAAAAPKASVATRFREQLGAKRVIIGFVVAAVGIASIYSTLAFALIVCAISVIAAAEFANLAKRSGGEVALPVALAACGIYPALAYVHLLSRFEPWLITAIVIASFAASLPADLDRFAGRCAMTVLAALYIGKMLSYLVLLRETPNGLAYTLWIVIIVALTDIVGMIAGLGFGQHPLAPRLSPAKTWEGAICALAVATLIGAVMWRSLQIHGPLWLAVVFPLSVSIAAEIGDLIESAFKRNAQVKDSGQSLPGHGGVLDRFDSYIFAGVVGYVALQLAGLL